MWAHVSFVKLQLIREVRLTPAFAHIHLVVGPPACIIIEGSCLRQTENGLLTIFPPLDLTCKGIPRPPPYIPRSVAKPTPKGTHYFMPSFATHGSPFFPLSGTSACFQAWLQTRKPTKNTTTIGNLLWAFAPHPPSLSMNFVAKAVLHNSRHAKSPYIWWPPLPHLTFTSRTPFIICFVMCSWTQDFPSTSHICMGLIVGALHSTFIGDR